MNETVRHTPGPWEVFIDDSGDEFTGWPLSITAPSVHEDCMVVRTGGQWPYEWDHRVSQAEAIANAHLIAAAPEMLKALKLADRRLHDDGYSVSDTVTAVVRVVIAKAEGRS